LLALEALSRPEMQSVDNFQPTLDPMNAAF
jgi:hypothetical protein